MKTILRDPDFWDWHRVLHFRLKHLRQGVDFESTQSEVGQTFLKEWTAELARLLDGTHDIHIQMQKEQDEDDTPRP